MRQLIRNTSIRFKLFGYGAAIATVIILVSGFAIGVEYWRSSQRNLEQKLIIAADLIGSNVISALKFKDSQAARTTLQSVEAIPDMQAAVLYDAEDRVVASYFQEGMSLDIPLNLPDVQQRLSSIDSAEVFYPIIFEQQQIGLLYLRSGTTELMIELARELKLMLILYILSVMLAVLVAIPLQRKISKPLLRLRAIADELSVNEDYSLRAPVGSTDEVGALAASFNRMIEQIELREVKIKQKEAELITLNNALKRSNSELSDFAHIASHDLQEPLRKVQTFGDQLRNRYANELSEEARHYVDRMCSAATRMRSLIEDLLALSRIMAKENEFKEVDLNELVDLLISEFSDRISEQSAEIMRKDLPVVLGDQSQLYRLFQNMISNALKYSRPNVPARVTIFVEPITVTEGSTDLVTVVVEDNGIGFEQRYAEQIFKAFQRLHGRDEYPGTGVGLAICAKIVERHGGTICAQGFPGEGSRFMIQLRKLESINNNKGEKTNDNNSNGGRRSGRSAISPRRVLREPIRESTDMRKKRPGVNRLPST